VVSQEVATLVISFLGKGEGKTCFSIGLAKCWKEKGKRVGFLKPVEGEEDCLFAQKILGLGEALTTLSPPLSSLKESLSLVSSNKDVVLLEASNSQVWEEVKGLGAKALLIPFYPYYKVEEVITAAQGFGQGLVGVIINAVPPNRFTSNPWLTPLKEKGIEVLGVLPQDRTLLALDVATLSRCLGGEILCCQHASNNSIENILVGVYSVDPAALYYQRRSNKAVIIKGERPEMQLWALETPTQCLILTGGIPPHPYVLQQAELKGVPIMVVEKDTLSVLQTLEEVMPQTRFHHEGKIGRIEELLREYVDWQTLEGSLAL